MNESDKQAEPVSDDESMWCRYIASMIGEYLGERLGSDKENAIAGIIERRLWNFPRKAQPVQPAGAVNQTLINAATKLADDLHELIGESEGVAGLHRNGEVADWESLMRGGRFESWLMSLDELDEALIEAGNHTENTLDKVGSAAAINEQLLEALENLALACGRNDGWEDYPREMKAANAAIAAAEAEKAKGGV